jgi:hypothetical protein
MLPLVRILVLATAMPWRPLPAAPIPEPERLLPPTAQRVAAICAAAGRDGWAAQVPGLRAAALTAYRRDKLVSAEAWYHVYRWAQLFGRPEPEFVAAWIGAVQSAQVGHANMPARYEPPARPLGAALGPGLQSWLVGHQAFSAEFFGLLSPVDYLPRVLAILAEIHGRDPARFKSHASLALAIALVHDVPPPPAWPHRQVSAAALPRRLPPAVDAFAWWIRQEQLGRTHHRLTRLGAGELKFVIDAAAPLAELEWAQRTVNLPLNQLAAAYSMVPYRHDRVTANQPVWTGSGYGLAAILAAGGICSDQAYFATQVGKARGVPTLLFSGAGRDGRHAWFGFLDGGRKWQLDAGRYAEQRFVTGYALDPQTWGVLSDHELQFLAERFRELPAYRSSRVHALFAADLLAAGETPAAAVAARKAVSFERRNQPGWEVLLAAARREGRDQKRIEAVLREAALAFQRYPDLQAHFTNRLAESLRARGQTSEADEEVRRIALKNQGSRGDLSVRQARESVFQVVATQPLPEQIRRYNTIVDTYGRGAGIGFFDEVVVPFAEHLLRLNRPAEALQAVERARRTLKVEPNSQLASEFGRLTKLVRAAPRREPGR